MRITEDSKSELKSWRPEVLSIAGTPLAARLTVRAFTYLDMGILYRNAGNYEKELSSYKDCERIALDLNDNTLLSLCYGSFVDVFMDKNMLDSALYYIQLEQKYTEESGYYKYYGSALNNIGKI